MGHEWIDLSSFSHHNIQMMNTHLDKANELVTFPLEQGMENSQYLKVINITYISKFEEEISQNY